MLSAATPAVEAAPAGADTLHVPAPVVWLFALGIVLTYLGALGHFPLAEPDEARYGEIAREMIELGDWVTPHLNYVKYFEKPPLIYWLTAVNFELFGTSEFVVRLWPALFGLLGIFVAYAAGRAMYGPWVGLAAAGLLATAPLYFGLSQIVVLDMPLSALMAVALSAFWFAYNDPARRRVFVWLLYGATALAVLTKGPVAVVLIGGVIALYLIGRADFAALRWLLSPLGISLFVVIAVPWFVLVSRRNPEFIDFFVVKQHVDRFLRPDEHQEPLWFFLPIVLAGMLPWTAFIVAAPRLVVTALGRLASRRTSAATAYCLLWAGVVFAFFSLSGSKLATYVLPMFCPLAILAARFFAGLIRQPRHDALTRGCAVVLVLAGVAIVGAVITGEFVDDLQIAPVVPRLYLGGLVLGGAAVVALRQLRRQRADASFATLIVGMLVLQAIAIRGRGVAAQYRPLGMVVRERAAAEDLIISYRHYVQGITFYGQRRVVMLGGRGELDFGSRQGRQQDFFWDSDAQLREAWGTRRHVFLVINRSELEPLRPQLQPPPRQIAAHGKKVIVVNFS